MEKAHGLDFDDPTTLTSFNIITEGDEEGLISKIFQKFKTAVSGPQQQQQHFTSPSSSTHTMSIVLSNESSGAVAMEPQIVNHGTIVPVPEDLLSLAIGGRGGAEKKQLLAIPSTASVINTNTTAAQPQSVANRPIMNNNNNAGAISKASSIISVTNDEQGSSNNSNATNNNTNKHKIPSVITTAASNNSLPVQDSTTSATTPTQAAVTPTAANNNATTLTSVSQQRTSLPASPPQQQQQKLPAVVTKPPSTTPTSSSSKSTIKRLVIDEEQNQEQILNSSMLAPLTKTSSCDSDTQSVMTTFSVSNTNSLFRVLNRLRGAETFESNKEFWMPDKQCRECFDCNSPFNLFRRKHHCRTCGRIFCSKCLVNTIYTNQALRVCNDCYSKFEDYRASADGHQHALVDGYGYDIQSSPHQQHLQKNFLIPTNKDSEEDDGSEEELFYERGGTNSLEIQRPNIDLHFSQSTSSHHTTSDNSDSAGIKKLLTNTFLRNTPRSRTSTINSLGVDTSFSALEVGRQGGGGGLNSPMPFRRHSFATTHGGTHGDGHAHNIGGPGGQLMPNQPSEYYEVEDDDPRRWDKNPRNLLNFFGVGGGGNGERPNSGIFNNFFVEDYMDMTTPTASNFSNIPVLSTSTSTTKAAASSWFMRPTSSSAALMDRSNIIRRRLSLSDSSTSNNNAMNGNSNSYGSNVFGNISIPAGNGGGNLTGTSPGAPPSRYMRMRTKSLMRNAPITTATMMEDSANTEVHIPNNSSPLLQHSTSSVSTTASVVNVNGSMTARCTTPDLDHLRSQIAAMSAAPTVVTHQEWDESFIYLMRNILCHLLEEEGLSTQEWQDVMMKLLLSIADQVQPQIRIRDTFSLNYYVKVKKLPGGLPKDSFLVNGVALSKSVGHKNMTRRIENPRILIINFDLDGHSSGTTAGFGNDNTTGQRHEYLKFDRLLAWERDHMNSLVDQIIGLRPSIVLFAASVPRNVIEQLNKAQIVVACNIKRTKLDSIARCSDATMFNYKNELWNAKSVAAGKCGLFETLTIMHEYLPNRRKTLLMFQQCPQERGAAVVLRGGNIFTLSVAKYIMKFMVQVVNNINLEAQFRKDFIELRRWNQPPFPDGSCEEDEDGEEFYNRLDDDSSTMRQQKRADAANRQNTTSSSFVEGSSVDISQVDAQSISALSVAESQITVNTMDGVAAKKRAQQQYQNDAIIVEDDDICLSAINSVLRQYQNTTLSISPGVTLPAPHVLLKLREAQKKLIGLIRERLGSAITGTTLSDAATTTSTASYTVGTTANSIVSKEIVDEKAPPIKAEPVIPPIPTDLQNMPDYLKAFDAYLDSDIEYRYYQDVHLQCWHIFKKYINGTHESLSPIYHQQILVHYTINPSDNHLIPCEIPTLEHYHYYDPNNDCTLGQYILNATKEAFNRCNSKICNFPLIFHDKTYSHGNAQIKVQVLPEERNEDDDFIEEKIEISRDEYLRKIPILICTRCHICKMTHRWKPMSDLLQRYSFGKFLELLFYHSESIPLYDDQIGNNSNSSYFGVDENDDNSCPHGFYRDHTISFGIQNLSVNFTHATVKVVEVSPPPRHLWFSSKQQISIKDAALDSTRLKICKFFDSIIDRNKGFAYDIVQPTMVDRCKEYLQEMSQEALKNKKSLLQKLQSEYANSALTDTLKLNNVLAELQNHAVTWDLKYIDFARRFVRPERELRKMTTNHLRKMFPAESLYNNSISSSAPLVSNLNLRTMRAIEAADLPLLDVGIDDDSRAILIGVSGTCETTVEDSLWVDLSLRDQPNLGESPTESYPWFDELKRFDQMFLQDRLDNEDIAASYKMGAHLNNLPNASFSSSYGHHFQKKIFGTLDTDASNLLSSSPAVNLNITIRDPETSEDLDPSVARRLSLELMKDMPKKKMEKQLHQQEDEQKQQKRNKRQYLEHSHITEKIPVPSAPPPSPPANYSPIAIGPISLPKRSVATANRLNHNAGESSNSPTEHGRQATGLPILSSTAYKRLSGLLPDPVLNKPKSSPLSANHLPVHQPQKSSPYHIGLGNSSKARNRKSQLYESVKNMLNDQADYPSPQNTSIPAPPPSTPKLNYYRGSPYAPKMNERTSFSYRHGFMGGPNINTPLSVISGFNNQKLSADNKLTSLATSQQHKLQNQVNQTTESSSSTTSQHQPLESAIPRPRSRAMAIVGNTQSSTASPRLLPSRGRIPIPIPSQQQHGTSSHQMNKAVTSNALIKFTPSYFGSSASHISFSPSSSPSTINNGQSSIPISPYHHGRKLSADKIRNIRQRLPSKASLEPFTKIKEIIPNDDESSSDEENDPTLTSNYHMNSLDTIESANSPSGSSDEDDEEKSLLPFQHNTFSLVHTDEYDESLGRESMPSILEMRQFNREHQLLQQSNKEANNSLPFLSVDSGMVIGNKLIHDDGSFMDLSKNNEAIMDVLSGESVSGTVSKTASDLEWSANGDGQNSILKAITYVLAEKSIGNLLPLEYPFAPNEHIFGDSNILVREDELSSIISYMLGSKFYNVKLQDNQQKRMSKATQMYNEKEKQADPEHPHQTFFSEMFPETDEQERPWKFAFQGGSTSFSCKIYFAEQFDMLRKRCGCDDIFISSLARCTNWDTAGGKSGSIFLKTKDERFLIKQISKYEMDAFLGSAPKYFSYMFNEVFDKEMPTVLCKIFGLYKIGFYNNVTGKSMKMDILVMENLFYDTSIKTVYDLKGSMRNRLAKKTGKDVEVFLDENLVETISETPLYMRVDTKNNLYDSLYNDTLFLLSIDVMDYSLLVGFDEEKDKMVVGIVDFIRTFTWDKKLESWVKESGMLGGGKKEPTIVSPKMYRTRFTTAIGLYFCMIPDFWTLCLD